MDELVKLATERPDARNPVIYNAEGVSTCLYTSPDDVDWHCIAGQAILDLTGIVIRSDVIKPVSGLDFDIRNQFDEEALDLLQQAQQGADQVVGFSNEDGQFPDKWGHVVKNMGLL